MISALPRAARGRIDRLAVGLWQSTAVESCDASKRRLTLPDETSCWTTDDCWKNADKTRQSQPSLDSASAARPKTRCKRSASVICGSNTRGQLFDSSHAQVQRLSMRRVAAASNKLQPQRCEHERPATLRGGSESSKTAAPTPPTREAARKVRENAQKAHRSPAAGLNPQPFRQQDDSRRSQSFVCRINSYLKTTWVPLRRTNPRSM